MKKIFMILAITSAIVGAYDRTEWIKASQWKTARRSVLARDSNSICQCWIDPYTKLKIDTRNKVDIDHIIPLNYVSSHGGESFSSDQKHKFATDPDNLLSVSQKANRSKGDKGLSEWMPSFSKCAYIKRWELVSKKYSIVLSKVDQDIINKNKNCKD